MKIIRLRRGFTEIQKVYELIQGLGFIAGGYARYVSSPRRDPVTTRDLDIFPLSKTIGFEEMKQKFLDLGFRPYHENDVSFTFNNSVEGFEETPTIQLIKPNDTARILTYGTPEQVLNNFDFTITRAAILSPTEVLVDDDFEDDELKMHLVLKNIHCPVSSLLRCCKYSEKGYFLKPVESIKLFKDWEERDDEYKTKITEFLVASSKFDPNDPDAGPLSREDVMELERLMMID